MYHQIQGKLDLVRVSGEFELSEFELAGFYCITFVHCTNSTHAIGQSQSRVFLLSGNNESFECSIDNNA